MSYILLFYDGFYDFVVTITFLTILTVIDYSYEACYVETINE